MSNKKRPKRANTRASIVADPAAPSLRAPPASRLLMMRATIETDDPAELLARFTDRVGFEIAVVWADRSTPVRCSFLRVNDVVLDHDHLLRRPQSYRLPDPIDGMFAVDWALMPQATMTGPLTIGIVNLATNARVIVDSVNDRPREEWPGDKVVDAP